VAAATDQIALGYLWAAAMEVLVLPTLDPAVLVMMDQADLTVVVVFVLSDILTLFNY